uniref:CD40 ligand n=1 Tax=Tetraodon nigroviridis TaxID=99883 RepID=H3BVM7_TETNG
MINTYQTSLAPPPVPPRHNRSHSVLIPVPHPSQGRSKPLVSLLVTLVFLQLLLSVGGFVYLYHNGNTAYPFLSPPAAHLSMEKEITSRILARMIVKKKLHTENPTSNYLQWDIQHSFLRDIGYYHNVWLTVQQSGDYYVYSRVTFSKGDPRVPLASMIKMRKNETDKEEKTVMQAYCSLTDQSGTQIPQLCTATQGEVVTLESGNQLSVWVQDLSLVDYEEGATTFGMYKL